MFSLDFDSLSSTTDLKIFLHFVIDTINCNRTMCCTIQGGIMLVISNQPRAMHLADLKSLAKLLPELYST